MSKSTSMSRIERALPVVTIAAALFGGAFCVPAGAEQFALVTAANEAKPADAPAAKVEEKEHDAKPANEKEVPTPANGAARKAKPAPKPRPAMRLNVNIMPGAANQNANAVEPQIRARLEPMLKVELSFANRVAGLNDDERRSVIAASKKWLDEFVVDFVKHQDPNQRQMWLQGMRMIGGQPTGEDPRESIQRGVAKVVAETLPKDKSAAYEAESRKRSEFYRKATVDNLVDLIDAKVILSPEQRQKITTSLNEHWDPSWAPQLEMFAVNNDMWPNVPDQWVSPELTASQRSVLSQLNRVSGQMIINGVGFGLEIGEIDDINLEDVPPLADNSPKD